jgi:hypothetical protein
MNFEIAPVEYWLKISVDEIRLYLFSLNIDGKTGWRLPTGKELNTHPFGEMVTDVESWSGFWQEADVNEWLPYRINNLYHFRRTDKLTCCPVRDLKDDEIKN